MAIRLNKTGESPVVTVPERVSGDKFVALSVAVSRMTTATPTFWTSATDFLTLTLLISRDGGTTWEQNGEWGAYGGIHIRRDGSEATHSYANFRIPAVPGLKAKMAWTAPRTLNGMEIFLTFLRIDSNDQIISQQLIAL